MEPASPLGRLRAWPYWPLVLFVLGVKALLLVHGALSIRVPWHFELAEPNGFFEIWNRWDAPNYLHIAEYGYQATGDKQHLLAFYPLYPALIRALEPLCGSFLAAGFWISSVASVAAALLFHRLVVVDHAEDATRALFFQYHPHAGPKCPGRNLLHHFRLVLGPQDIHNIGLFYKFPSGSS